MIPKNKLIELVSNSKKENITRFVVGAIISNENKILLLQRPKDDFMGGILELPSGKVENNEELDEALKREVKEETNLDIYDIIEYLGYFDYESKSGNKTRQFNFFVEIKEFDDIKLTEHDSFVWISKDEINTSNASDSVKKILIDFFNV